MLRSVLLAYGFKVKSLKLEAFGSGLINSTWKVITPEKEYILQRVNNNVFKDPGDIAHNISLITEYLKQHHPEYKFVAPMISTDGEEMIYQKGEGFFRMFPFVAGSHSKDVAETPEQACVVAAQFGRFTRLLSGIDISQLKITIPFFHDLTLRYQQFLMALENGNKQRITESDELIKELEKHVSIISDFASIKSCTEFKLRVTHHDTKISNVLFNAQGKGLCVIDLDTVMPGYFISDLGDMMRTYLSPANEEEKDFSAIKVREDFYKAIVKGYYNEMKDDLTETEKKYFFYAGKFMIYMQALRFLTDYLNDDDYYGAKYTGHNLLRACNQMVLLQRLLEKEVVLSGYRG